MAKHSFVVGVNNQFHEVSNTFSKLHCKNEKLKAKHRNLFKWYFDYLILHTLTFTCIMLKK